MLLLPSERLEDDPRQEILKATYENCKVLLRSDLIKSSSEERSLLKNLGSWLGKFTIDDKQLVPGLISLIEQGTDVLRVKALLFVALLCKNSRRWLPHFFCNAKLISAVDRLGKEKEGFIHHCTEAFVQLVASLVPGILDTVSSDIQQVMVGKRHGPVTALAGRAHPKSTIHLFPVILHLLGSASFKHRVVTGHVLFKNLTVDIKDVKPTSLLKDRLREVEGNPKLGSLGPQLQYSKIMDLALDKANREIIHRQGSSSLTSATWSW
uniref:Serine/threonine-protein kinase RUNKEL n=1 Tax=Zea mays TaxID=4577 RepID=A0A804PH36_MAIZE